MAESILIIDKVFLKRWKSAAPLRGVELFNLLLIRDLVRRGHPVTLVAEKSWDIPVQRIMDDVMPECIWLPNFGATFINGVLGAARLMFRRFDVLIVGNVGDGISPAVRIMRLTRIFHTGILIAHREASSRFVKAFASMPGHILAVNNVIADPFRKESHPSVHVDYGILNADLFYPSTGDDSEKEKVDFCVLGALDNPWKGADTVVTAFRALPDNVRSGCRLHLAAYEDPPRYDDDGITVYDWMPADRVPEFLRNMDVMIVPSRDEGVMRETFSQAVVQGMLSGLPVIHSELFILTEKFDRGGGVEFKTREELTRAMTILASDKERRLNMGRLAREIAAERYVWDTSRFIERYITEERIPVSRPAEDNPLLFVSGSSDQESTRSAYMGDMNVHPVDIGGYKGLIAAERDTPAFREWLKHLPREVASNGRTLSAGRDRVAVVDYEAGETDESLAVKQFSGQSMIKDRIDAKQGSKALRSFNAGQYLRSAGVGTPEPVACIDRWEKGRLLESYHVTRYEPYLRCFRDELIHIYRHEPDCDKLMTLLECVASAVKRMHDAGLQHRDMGNQNILMRRRSDGSWKDVMFVDLNRARAMEKLTLRHRAFDISRISLPSDFLRVFKAMYFSDRPVPAEFEKWERFYRKRFALHTWSRVFRHPVRTRRRRRDEDAETTYPDIKDIWIWDERSAQAISVMQRKDRRKRYPLMNSIRIASSSITALSPVHSRYKEFIERAYAEPVDMAGRIGMAVNPRRETWEFERSWLDRLGRIPVILRFYHHETPEEWNYIAERARELHDSGHSVSVAVVQDRRAVLEPGSWDAFTQHVMEKVSDIAEWVEIGHAINRVKWGVWNIDEYIRLVEPFTEWSRRSECRFMGPAVIDFEYHYLVNALKRLDGLFRFQSLSHHLYVDRRGAPENLQAGFSTLGKLAMARAISEWSNSCDGGLIVSEVNWPILGTGVYSPVGSPYQTPGPRMNDPSVTEDEYADYMIRYLVIAIASGMAERVYWWRLAAHGFGLIDDRNPDSWRARPAFHALRYFLEILGAAVFESRLPSPGGSFAFLFRLPGGEKVAMAYAHPDPMEFRPGYSFDKLLDALGEEIPVLNGSLRLTGRPVYLRGVDL